MSRALYRTAREVDNAWGIIDSRAAKSAKLSGKAFAQSGIGPIDITDAERKIRQREEQELEAAGQRKLEITKRISDAMAAQRLQILNSFGSGSSKITAETSMFAEMARADEVAGQRKLEVERRISQAMALQRQQTLAIYTGGSGNKITAANSMFAQMATQATLDTKKLWAAQVQAKVAANALAYSLGVSGAGAAGAIGKAGNAAVVGSKKMSKFGVITQQTGYQVQDFVVQVTGGQSALVALSQQGSQWLSIFGAGGAIAGAALSIGVIVARMAMLANETNKTVIEYKSLTEAAKGLRDVERERALIVGGESKRLEFSTEDRLEKEAALSKALKQREALETRLARVLAYMPTDEAGFNAQAVNVLVLNQQIKSKTLEIENARIAALEKTIEQETILERFSKEAIRDQQARNNLRVEFNKTLESSLASIRNEFAAEAGGTKETVAEFAKQADAIRDSLDPMRELQREQEKLNKLVAKGFLTQVEADRFKLSKRKDTSNLLPDMQANAYQRRGLALSPVGMGTTAGKAPEVQLLESIDRTLKDARRSGGIIWQTN